MNPDCELGFPNLGTGLPLVTVGTTSVPLTLLSTWSAFTFSGAHTPTHAPSFVPHLLLALWTHRPDTQPHPMENTAHTHAQERVSLIQKTEKDIAEKTEWALIIRFRAWSHECTDLPLLTPLQHLLSPFRSIFQHLFVLRPYCAETGWDGVSFLQSSPYSELCIQS